MLHEAQRTSPAPAGEALTELYRLYAAEAFRFAVHLTGRKEDAEDVLQQVFLQAHRHLESGAELVNPRAWLMIAVKHRVFNLQRARREMPAAEIEPGRAYAPATDDAEELTAVRGVLWTLPEKQHQAFVLRYWSGLSQLEIAQVLGTTASAVESLLVRARTTLMSERENGSEECERVRLRLVEGGQLTGRNHDHLRTCSRCRAGHLRLSRIAEFASVVSLAPSLHVAHSLAGLVPGFSVPAASLSVVGGTSAAGASGIAGTATLTGTSSAATAATASGKLAIAVKVALAVAATTAAATAVPQVHTAVDRTLFPHHVATASAASNRPAAPSNTGSAGAQTSSVGTSTGSGSESAGGSAAGTGNGKAKGQGNGKAKGQGNGKAKGQGNGKAKGNANGQGNGNANGQGNGKAKGQGNGNANGQGKAVGQGSTKVKGSANGKSNGAAKGKADGATKSAATGKAKGKTKTATTTTTGNGNGNGKGNANGNGNGKAKGTTTSDTTT